MKKINIKKVDPDYCKLSFVYDNYCPYEVIKSFWEKYSLLQSKHFVFRLQQSAAHGHDNNKTRSEIEIDNRIFSKFCSEIEELLNAVYFDYKYNNKKSIRFVEKGGTHDQ